jgi:hypothetical protein
MPDIHRLLLPRVLENENVLARGQTLEFDANFLLVRVYVLREV